MSDTSQGPGWWQASDGKWYPPAGSERPAPGWWLASDGNWYPPEQAPATADPRTRTPVKPVAKPRAAETPTNPVARASGALDTPPGPAVAPGAAPTTPAPAATATPSAAGTAKPAAAAPKGPDAAPATPPAGPRPPAGAEPRPTLSGGLSPDQQIRVRNEQSRRDAAVLFNARKTAATRALGNISALLEQEKAAAGAAPATPKVTDPQPPVAPGRASPPAPKSRGKMGRVIQAGLSAATASDRDRGADQPIVVDDTPTEPPAPKEPPLLEVKQGTLAADIEHIGERLVIFNDRVELHDRSDRVRQVIAGADIADVVVHKRFTGSTVTVESGTGESIVAKGLKPEQADEIRAVILKRTRAGIPAGATPAPAPTRPPRSEPREPIVDARDPKPAAPLSRTEGAELFAKLADLHRAGILTDAELAEKRALVERLVEGESLAVPT